MKSYGRNFFLFCSENELVGLTKYLKVSWDFNAQMKAYLLKDSERRERVETTVSMGNIQYHEAKVLVDGKEVEQEWLTITGVVADALIDGQEIIYTSYKGTDGSFKDAEILQVKKRDGETRLIYREPRVILEKLRGKK